MSNYRPRTLQEYGQLMWQRRRTFFLVALAMLLSTFAVIGQIPDQYHSSASVVVAGKQEDRQAVAARVATITERINSRSLLEPLIEKHALYPGLVAAGATEVAVNRMRKDIKVETRYRNENPEAVIITYRNPNAEVAKAVATDLLSVFGKMNDAIEQQMEDRGKLIETELGQIEGRLRQLGEQQSIASARARAASFRNQMAAAQSSAGEISDKQYAIEQQIAEQKRQIEEQGKIASTAPGDTKSGGSYGVLLVRQAELEGQLKDFQTQYTDKNPKVIQARTQLGEINRQIAQMNAAAGKDGVPLNSPEARELRAMQRELSRMNIELEVTRREATRKRVGGPVTAGLVMPASADVPIANIAGETDKDRLKSRYDSLLRQQDELVRMQSLGAGLDPGLFQIIDQPAQPILPGGPDRGKLRLIAIALAIGAGLVAVAALEGPRLFTIRDDRDVRYYLGTRVVALIPETLTPVERGRSRKMMVARTVGLLLLFSALIPVLVLVLNGLKVFQLMASRW